VGLETGSRVRQDGGMPSGMIPWVARWSRRRSGAMSGVVLWALLVAGCGDGEASKSGAAKGVGGSPATAPLDYLAAQGQAKKHSEKVVSLAQVQQALQQFHVTEDRWPKDLQELVKAGLLVAVPTAPAGQRLMYDPASGTVRMVRVQP